MVTFGLLQSLHGFSLLGFLKSVVVAALTIAAVCLFFAYLPVLGAVALIAAVVVAVVLVRQRRPQASPVEDPPAQGSPAGSAADEAQRRELLRHMEILKDCEELVNSSNNFSTVLSRYDLLLQELSYFAAFEEIGPDYLPSYGINFKTPASELWKRYFDNMAEYLNAAVDRILDAEIERPLRSKPPPGQEKHMAAWVDKLQELEGVPAGTLQYINELPVAAALREPKVSVSCPCGNEFQGVHTLTRVSSSFAQSAAKSSAPILQNRNACDPLQKGNAHQTVGKRPCGRFVFLCLVFRIGL